MSLLVNEGLTFCFPGKRQRWTPRVSFLGILKALNRQRNEATLTERFVSKSDPPLKSLEGWVRGMRPVLHRSSSVDPREAEGYPQPPRVKVKEGVVIPGEPLRPLTLVWVLLLACCLLWGLEGNESHHIIGSTWLTHKAGELRSWDRSETQHIYGKAANGHPVPMASVYLPREYFVRRGTAEPVRPAPSRPVRISQTPFVEEVKPITDRPTSATTGAPPPKRRGPVAPQEALTPNEGTTQAPWIAVSADGAISANIRNRPLGEVLGLMSEKHLFEIEGSLPGGALATPVTMRFSGLTLDEALRELMLGYNYAVITEDTSNKRMLMVVSEARSIGYGAPAKPAPAAEPGKPVPEEPTALFPEADIANPTGTPVNQRLHAFVNAAKPAPPTFAPQASQAPLVPEQEQKASGQVDVNSPIVQQQSSAPPPTENQLAAREE